ncbi:hypothetical protein [Desertimonas flava]|nr:hypothetical protein [Desertimonas flava]
MTFNNALMSALVPNVVVWWIYIAQEDRGFPWPIFVTIASVGGLVAVARRRQAPVPTEGGRSRNRNRDRSARRSARP